MGTGSPNTYCVILGRIGQDPLSIVGPFATMVEAQAHAAEHEAKTPPQVALAELLVDPANCP